MSAELAAACPNPDCGHLMSEHLFELGCNNGWDAWSGGDPDAPEPCECHLTLAQQYGPPSEKGGVA